ncbi:hypothetical protein GIY56_13025 [Paracoccus sp. YIM 132242]|uniref:Uncharacterized protein n=1 Tax=Paracoccus lichenicola TaxID=2665644 RepID=A0A6L6HSD3_9RHOB|nr:hypothetical protein [Paracoccus lichenicola]MTE01210.1 hypothetical protein [Paracoccus lichenicola]
MDHSDTGLRAICKSLTDVIAPSLQPDDPLAREQLGLIVHYLEFLRSRLDHLHARERFQLADARALAARVRNAVQGASGTATLESTIAAADDLLADPWAATGDLREATARANHAVSEIVQAAPGLPAEVSRRLSLAVIDGSGDRIAMERAWYLPMGLDPSPAEILPLETLLRRHAGDHENSATAE